MKLFKYALKKWTLKALFKNHLQTIRLYAIKNGFDSKYSTRVICHKTSAGGVMVIVVGNGHDDTSSNQSISHSTNTLGKGMNPIILPPAMGKIVGQTRFFNLGEATSLGEGKLWI